MQLGDDSIAMSPPDSDLDEFDSVETSSTERPPLTNPPLLATALVSNPKLIKGKARERIQASQKKKRPLTLLELPVDILRLIVKEITHTNDLTSLALANSTLHTLAIPHIYARFDIVWPDAHMTTTDTKSVDALTYGLSTLTLGSTFSRIKQRFLNRGPLRGNRPPLNAAGNSYAIHTRKFSLGNGPQDWVAEYMITKESGKMLGTLVAMAVAKMKNLETFVWDMPTGVLAEIFLALASLPDHHKDGECNLEKVWIRWHDNSDALDPAPSSASSPVTSQPPIFPSGSTMSPVGVMLPQSLTHPTPKPAIPYSASTVEYPTFSVLPPVRSLTVLDIDELAYLDEMSMLIERSQDRLQELRVGISPKAQGKDFVQAWDGPDLHQVDHDAHWPGASTIGDRRLGGVLGTLVGRIYDIRRKPGTRSREKPAHALNGNANHSGPNTHPPSTTSSPTASGGWTSAGLQSHEDPDPGVEAGHREVLTNGNEAGEETQAGGPNEGSAHDPVPDQSQGNDLDGQDTAVEPGEGQAKELAKTSSLFTRKQTEAMLASMGRQGRKRLEGKLRLHTLELERIPLSMQVCSRAIDWTTLANLTILDCAQHETLWKLLRRQFQPTSTSGGYGISSSSRHAGATHLQYHLNLKQIHTDNTSPSLISFLKEALAPNSLEVLFLQDRRKGHNPPTVTIDSIYKGVLKRHRLSLRKLLLDSSAKVGSRETQSAPGNTRWLFWVLTTEVVMYITSGRMSNLRELAVSLAYRDWHTFLQRLPNIPQLRSLNIPHVVDHAVVESESRELAMQITDIITLRPEIQLCYVGISKRCFEILESPSGERSGSLVNGAAGPGQGDSGDTHAGNINSGQHSDNESLLEIESEEEAHDETSEEEDGDETEDEDGVMPPDAIGDPDETQSEGHSDVGADSEDDDGFVDSDSAQSRSKLRLREILFYDDKVAIFKARHGRL